MTRGDAGRAPLELILIVLALLTFFMPLATANVPIVGSMSWSGLNWVSLQIGAGDEDKPTPTEMGANLAERSDEGEEELSMYSRVVMLMAAATPGMLLAAYIGVLALLVNWLRDIRSNRWIARGVVLAGIYSIVTFYLLADVLYRSLRASMASSSSELEDNPFAALGEMMGQALTGSFSLDPGVGLWVLTGAAAVLVAIRELDIQIGTKTPSSEEGG